MTNSPFLQNVLLVSGRGHESSMGLDLNPIHAVKAVGRAVGNAVGTVTRPLSSANAMIMRNLKKIPIVGPPLKYTVQLGMGTALIDTTDKIAHGKRIDKVAYETVSDHVKAVEGLAPFAALIVGAAGGGSVGSGAEGVAATGNIAAKGPAISDTVVTTAMNEIPPAGREVFKQAFAGISQGAMPTNAQVAEAVKVTNDVLDNKGGSDNLDRVIANFSPDQQKGIRAGLAFGVGKKIQKTKRSAIPHMLPSFINIGRSKAETSAVVKLGAQELRHRPEMQKGFFAALGFLHHKQTPTTVEAMRESLPTNARAGFDMAAALKIGQLAHPLPSSVTPREQMGYYLAKGSVGMKPSARHDILKTVADPTMLKGVRKGLNEDHVSIWKRIWRAIFGVDPIAKTA